MRVSGMRVEAGQDLPGPDQVADALGWGRDRIREVILERRSLDGRRRPPAYELRLRCRLHGTPGEPLPLRRGRLRVEWMPSVAPTPPPTRPRMPAGFRPIVVGAGPAGLWAALTLARLGAPPLLIERGGAVEARSPAVNRHWRDGILDPENNVLYGEGGAGTFSDGKIYTRIRDGRVGGVLRDLHELGAPPDILTDARPHIGTDRLKVLLMRLRRLLLDLGVEVRYGVRVDGLVVAGRTVRGVRLAGGGVEPGPCVVLAPGHSARDTFRWLAEAEVPMEARPTAMGVRIEHPQELLDRIQYGCAHASASLPPADYSLAIEVGRDHRRVWSFCMCPGGKVISASNEVGCQVTNGMSYSRRSADSGNAGLVVEVGTEAYARYGPAGDPLAGVLFQAHWEQRAWEAAGGGFRAPAQRAADFLRGRASEGEVPATSYLPGVELADLATCLPGPITEALRQALRQFDERMPGFAGSDALLIGIESRTSAPLRILRDAGGESTGMGGLYPVGEGAGYAGGIVSAAVDGVVAAEAIADRFGATAGAH